MENGWNILRLGCFAVGLSRKRSFRGGRGITVSINWKWKMDTLCDQSERERNQLGSSSYLAERGNAIKTVKNIIMVLGGAFDLMNLMSRDLILYTFCV